MRLSRSRVRVNPPVCKEIAENSQIEVIDTTIPSFCSDADHDGKNGLRLSHPTDVKYLKRYISSLLKEFFKQKNEIRLLRLQLEDSRCKQITQMESERWNTTTIRR